MIYEYECGNCKYDFEEDIPLKDRHIMPKCPKCNLTKEVKKVIRTAVPKSQSWRA